jgi:hypothetical protein
MKDRFAKLAALTRGAALVTLSTSAAPGCTKNEPPPAPVTASAIQPDPAAADPGDAAVPIRRRFPILNAVHPGTGWNTVPDGGTRPADGGTTNGP